MSNEMITTQGRSSAVIAVEIRTIVRQTQEIILRNAMEIGKRLLEAKELVPQGEWMGYVERECEFSQSTANNMMKLYKEYGSDQQSLFGGNSKAFEAMPYTKALRLLAVPSEDREAFAQQVDAEHISTRELDAAIKERDRAIEQERAARELQMEAQANYDAAEKFVGELQDSLKKKEAEAKNAQAELKKVQKDLEAARKAETAAKAETRAVKESKNHVPDDLMAQMRREAEELANTKATAAAEAKLRAAEEKARKAEEARAAAEEKLEAAKRSQGASDPETAVFSAYFQQVQEDFNKCAGVVLKVRGNDPEKAQKFVNAMDALLSKMQKAIHGEV